jgi:hypothetical protein
LAAEKTSEACRVWMGSAFEPLCVVQKRAAALRKKIDSFNMGADHHRRKVRKIIIATVS